MDINARGSCLCRSVKFTVKGSVQRFYTCHCSRCRKETGSAFATNAFVSLDAVEWVSGEDHAARFELPEAEHFCLDFCRTCGSTIPYLSRNRQFYIVPVGSLDVDLGICPTAQIFWADRAPWLEEAMESPRFDGPWNEANRLS